MKVPTLTTTRTRAPNTTQTQYASSATSLAQGGENIGRALASLGAAFKQRDQQAERFNVSRMAIEETTQLQQDFQQRQLDAPLGAEGFTQAVLGDYTSRHEGVLQRMRDQGFSEEAVRDMDVRLAGLRNNLVGQSLSFQEQSYRTKIAADMEGVGTNLSQIAGMNPYEVDAAIEELNATVDEIPNLSATDKQALKDRNAGAIRMAAGMGLASQDPGLVVSLLSVGEQGPAAYRNAIASIESAGSGGYAAIGPTHPTLGRALGKYQIMEANIGPWSEKHLGRRVSVEEFMANPDIQDQIFDGEFGGYVRKYGLEGAAQAWFGGEGAIGKTGRRDVLGTSVGGYGQKFLKALGSTGVPSDGKTGNPVLDNLTAQERMQVLNQARSVMNRTQTSARGMYDNMIDNAEAAYMTTGQYDGPLPTREQLHQAFDPWTAENKWAQIDGAKEAGTFIQGMVTQSSAEIANSLAALRPTDTASPTYARDLKTFESAQRAANEVLKQRDSDPANYVIRNYPAAAAAWTDPTEEGRQAAFTQMYEAYEQLGIPDHARVPFPQGTLDTFKANFSSASPEAKLQMLQSWRAEMGPLYPQGLKQLADSGLPVEAYLSGLLAEAPGHADVAANVLRGQAMIAADKSLKPAYAQVNETFRASMGDAQRMLNPQASQAINEAATALYIFNGGDPETLDPAMYESALRQVLGGTADNPDTGIVDLRPTNFLGLRTGDLEKTILPPDVSGTDFVNWKDGLVADELIEFSKTGEPPVYGNEQPVPPEDIVNEGVFVKVAPNQYIVKMSSDGLPLVTPSGEYYVMNLPTSVFGVGVEVGPLEWE